MLIPTYMSTPNGQLINNIHQVTYDGWTGINASSLKKFMVSPMHYKDWVDKKDSEPTSDAFRFGTAFHMAVLEPDRFAKHFIQAPEVDRRTTVGKATWAEFQSKLNFSGDNYLTKSEYDSLASMIFCVNANKFWNEIKSDKESEYREAGFECEYLGVEMKGRIDYFNKDKNVIIDWKTINDTPTKRTVKNEIYSKGYDVQNFIYQKGVEIVTGVKPKFYFAFIEKKAPHSIAFYELPEWRMNEVKEMVDVELVRMENAKKTNFYAGLPSENCPMMLE